MTIQRVCTVPVNPGKSFDIRKECGRLWSDISRLHNFIRKRSINNPGFWKWPLCNSFEKHFKGKYNLHSQTVQGIIQKFFANIKTALIERKNGNRKMRLPYKPKFFFNPIFKGQSIKRFNNRIRLPVKNRKYLWFNIPDIDGEIVQAELGFDKLYLTIKRTIDFPDNTSEKVAAVDVGLIHTAVITDGINSLAVVGRGIRSIKQGHAKNLAKLSKLISKTKPSSIRRKKLLKAKRRLVNRTKNLIRNALHHVSRHIVKFCVKHNIGTVVVGDISKININNRKRRRKQCNQEIGKIEFGTLFKYLKYKLEEQGIELEKVSEEYTSQTCPVCGILNKPCKRKYKCRHCGYTGIRDLVGASNIRNMFINNIIKHNFSVPDNNLKYLRPVRIKSVGRSSMPQAQAKVA